MKTYKEFRTEIGSKTWDDIAENPKLVGHIPSNINKEILDDPKDRKYLKSIGKARLKKAEDQWKKIIDDPEEVGSIPSNYPGKFKGGNFANTI